MDYLSFVSKSQLYINFSRAQLDMMTEMNEVHGARLNDLVSIHVNERDSLLKKSTKERKKLEKNQNEIEHYLDDVVIALNQRHVALEAETKNEYSAIKEDVRNKNLEEKQALQLYLEETTDNMWKKLQAMVIEFKSETEEKRRHYNELLSKDKKGVSEVAENNKKIEKLMVTILGPFLVEIHQLSGNAKITTKNAQFTSKNANVWHFYSIFADIQFQFFRKTLEN